MAGRKRRPAVRQAAPTSTRRWFRQPLHFPDLTWPVTLPEEGCPFETPDLADKFLADAQATGHIRRCAHVSIKRRTDRRGDVYYRPVCDEASFHVEREAGGPVWPVTYITFHGCPHPCQRYRSARLAALAAG